MSSRLLPLYYGPQITIRIGGDSDHEYTLSKDLICSQSRYFEKMFGEGRFKEGEEKRAILEPVGGVVTTRSFQMLVQWLHQGRVVFPSLDPEEEITLALEFVRISDMCEVIGMEAKMADHIKGIILKTPVRWTRHPDTHTTHLSSEHLIATSALPSNHPVRKLFAIAAVEGYIRSDTPKFLKEMQDIPEFAVDLLAEVKVAINSFKLDKPPYLDKQVMYFRDPMTGEYLQVKD